MALPLLDDHREISAEFLVFLLRHPRLAVEPWIEAVANVQDRHAGLGEQRKIVNVGHFCVFVRVSLRDHGAAQDGILADKMHSGPRLMSPFEFSLRLSCALLYGAVIASKHGAGGKMRRPATL
jgi:hypothetical protein